jgi:hypothetical protein
MNDQEERPVDFLLPLAGYCATFLIGVVVGITYCTFAGL